MTDVGFADEWKRDETLRPEVAHILELVGLSRHIHDICRIAEHLTLEDKSVIDNLTVIDRTIPGLGFADINERTPSGSYIGVYQIADRPIFRGIQYVGMHLGMDNIEWLCRTIVTESCYHLENSLKRRLRIREDQRDSVGRILSTPGGKRLERSIKQPIAILNRAVYNKAKHTIEDIDLDSHMFSVADAIAIYLSCRVLGARLIGKLELETKYGIPIFQQTEADRACEEVQLDTDMPSDGSINSRGR